MVLNLTIRTVLVERCAMVELAGEVDLATSPELATALNACLTPSLLDVLTRIRVDMTSVDFCDCRGLSTLLCARERARAAGVLLTVHDPQPIVARLFEVTGTAAVLVGRAAAA